MRTDRYILAVMVTALLVGTLVFTDPGITGYVPTELQSQSLDIDVFESQRFQLKALEGLSLSSLSISGTVEGPGLVKIYLTNNKERLLVYSNLRKQGSSMEQITGMYQLELVPQRTLATIESVPEGYTTEQGVVSSQCIDTCVINEDLFDGSEWFLDIVIEPGTSLHISQLHFAR